MPTDERPWTDADRELTVSVLWTRALQGGNAGPALDLQPAADAPQHMWADAAALLDALTAAGWMRGHCPGCDCPDVPNDGTPPTRQLTIGDTDA